MIGVDATYIRDSEDLRSRFLKSKSVKERQLSTHAEWATHEHIRSGLVFYTTSRADVLGPPATYVSVGTVHIIHTSWIILACRLGVDLDSSSCLQQSQFRPKERFSILVFTCACLACSQLKQQSRLQISQPLAIVLEGLLFASL